MSETLEARKCPKCGAALAYTGAPIHEDYCPNKDCTYDLDQMMGSIRKRKLAHEDGLKAIREAQVCLPAMKQYLAHSGGPDVWLIPMKFNFQEWSSIIAALEAAEMRVAGPL